MKNLVYASLFFIIITIVKFAVRPSLKDQVHYSVIETVSTRESQVKK